MKDGPIILGDGLEIHYIQELYGNNDEILDIYELRKNFGRGRIKTLKRVDVLQGSDLEAVRTKIRTSRVKGDAGHD